MTMDQSIRAWEMQPGETQKAFAAFCVYRDLQPFGDPPRNLPNAIRLLGLKDGGSVERWSAKNKWVDRVAAYDAWQANNSITLVQASKEQYANILVSQTSARLTYLGKIVEKLMKRTMIDIDNDKEIDPADVKRLVEMVKTIDDLGRRGAGLPTSYIGEKAAVTPDEEQTFVVGGDD